MRRGMRRRQVGVNGGDGFIRVAAIALLAWSLYRRLQSFL